MISKKPQTNERDPSDQYHTNGEYTVWNGPRYPLSHHWEFWHTTNSGKKIERHKNYTDYRQLFDDLVLINIDETNNGIHKKIDLVE